MLRKEDITIFPRFFEIWGGVGLKGGGRAKLGAFFPHIGIMDENKNYIPGESTDKSSLSWEIRKKLEEGPGFVKQRFVSEKVIEKSSRSRN